MRQDQQSAVITIYFSLILGMIVVLMTTMIETARVSAANTYISRVLQTSMESALCDYYLPLFEDYQLFGFHIPSDSNVSEVLSEKVSQRIEDSFSPLAPESDGLWASNQETSNFLICNPCLQQVTVTDPKRLTEEDGAVMRAQAAAYMKYSAPLHVIESILDAKGMLKKSDDTSMVLQEKLEIEQKFAVIDQNILKLIELIDGVRTDSTGIWQSAFLKHLSANDVFIKKQVNFEVTQSSVQINHTKIFEVLEEEYRNSLVTMQSQLEIGRSQYEAYEKRKKEEQEAEVPPEDSQLIWMEMDESINYTSTYMMQMLGQELQEMKKQIDQALSILDTIQKERMEAADALAQFQEHLEEKKELLPEGIYEELGSLSSKMEQYADVTYIELGMIPNVVVMHQTLEKDRDILNDLLSYPAASFSFDPSQFTRWEAYIQYWINGLSSYSHAGLCFDYSQVTLSKQSNEILSTVRNLIAKGSVSLMLEDTTDVSKAALSGVELPSAMLGSSIFDSLNHLKNMLTHGSEEFQTGSAAGLGMDSDLLSQDVSELAQALLFVAYLNEHTTNYCSDNCRPGQVLKYEQEYLLFGNQEDSENLNCCALRLLELRTIGNFIYLLTDQEKILQAQTFALSVVGATGLTFLVSAVKYVTLFIWALVQGLVETSALLMGKEVPIFTTKQNFLVKFSDLLQVSNQHIVTQAKKYEAKSAGLIISYSQYLLLLLLFRSQENNSLRMMDLIQENLRYEYEDEFRIAHCYVSFHANAACSMPQKFFFLPFFQKSQYGRSEYEFAKKCFVTY